MVGSQLVIEIQLWSKFEPRALLTIFVGQQHINELLAFAQTVLETA